MKEEFKRERWEDFQARYQGTYGWYSLSNRKVLVRLTRVREDSLTFTDKTGFEYSANPDCGNVFTFLPLTRGCYQYKENVVVVQRVPRRQWKRGICDGNTSIHVIGQGAIAVDFDVLEEIFKPKAEIPFNINTPTAINNIFSIVMGYVYLYDRPIAKVDKAKMEISCLTNLFKQEIQDLCRNYSLPLEVV